MITDVGGRALHGQRRPVCIHQNHVFRTWFAAIHGARATAVTAGELSYPTRTLIRRGTEIEGIPHGGSAGQQARGLF